MSACPPIAEVKRTSRHVRFVPQTEVNAALSEVVNFGILAGTLVYLLRTPLATYLRDRSTQIRSDLVNAEEMKKSAAMQIQEIDRKMKALCARRDPTWNV